MVCSTPFSTKTTVTVAVVAPPARAVRELELVLVGDGGMADRREEREGGEEVRIRGMVMSSLGS